eukprot:s836_g19.t1
MVAELSGSTPWDDRDWQAQDWASRGWVDYTQQEPRPPTRDAGTTTDNSGGEEVAQARTEARIQRGQERRAAQAAAAATAAGSGPSTGAEEVQEEARVDPPLRRAALEADERAPVKLVPQADRASSRAARKRARVLEDLDEAKRALDEPAPKCF